jgi:hypothetical protein
LVVRAVRGKPSSDYIYWSFGEVRLHVRQDLVRDRLRQMLHVSRQSIGGFLQSFYQWSNLGPAWMWKKQSCNWERGFLKLFELVAQLLAVFVQLLQRFIAVTRSRSEASRSSM